MILVFAKIQTYREKNSTIFDKNTKIFVHINYFIYLCILYGKGINHSIAIKNQKVKR